MKIGNVKQVDFIDYENYSAVVVLLQSGREFQIWGAPNRETGVTKPFGLRNCAVQGDRYKIVVLGVTVPCVLDARIES